MALSGFFISRCFFAMVERMQTLEGYGSAQTYVQAEQHPPIEQLGTVDIEDQDICLSGIALYMREVRQVQRLSPEAEQQAIAQAQQGDQDAKHRLIEDRLPYIMHMATRYHAYAEHEDLMDIVGVGNLAVTACIDKALAKDIPSAYLCGVAKREIRNYCFYRSRLMPIKDHHTPLAEAPTVVRLDEQRADEQGRYQSLPTQDCMPDDTAHSRQLRQVLDYLPDHERQVVELRHGLHGSICEFSDIAGVLSISRPAACQRYYRAMARLRKLVAASWCKR